MTFKEYLEKNAKVIQNMHFENMNEFKKFADKEEIIYSDEELNQAWNRVKSQNASEDGAIGESDLSAVAGGIGDVIVDSTITTTVNNIKQTQTTTTNIEEDHSVHNDLTKSVKIDGNVKLNKGLTL